MAVSIRVLLIEDDRDISSTLRGVLESNGHEVLAATNGVEGQKLIESEEPDLVITDMMMPRMGGFPVLEFMRTLENPPRVIMITANEGGRHKAYAEMLGVDEYLRKPFAMDAIVDAIKRIFGDQEEKKSAQGGKSKREAADKTEKPSARMKRASKKRS